MSQKRSNAKGEELEKLMSLGQRMSNVMFNLSQCKEITEQHRETFRELYQKWDTLMTNLRNAQPRQFTK